MLFIASNHIFKICGGQGVKASAAIFRKYGVKTSLGVQSHYAMKDHLDLSYLNDYFNMLC